PCSPPPSCNGAGSVFRLAWCFSSKNRIEFGPDPALFFEAEVPGIVTVLVLAHDEHEAPGDLPDESEVLHLLPLERIILRDPQELAVAEKPLLRVHGQGIPFIAPDDFEDIRVFRFPDLSGKL